MNLEGIPMLPELQAIAERLTVRCPTCGADDQLGPDCRRCRSDLRLLVRIEEQRAGELRELHSALRNSRWADALAAAQFLHTLRPDATSLRLLAICQLLCQQWNEAARTHREHAARCSE